jgi:hypothetical protein
MAKKKYYYPENARRWTLKNREYYRRYAKTHRAHKAAYDKAHSLERFVRRLKDCYNMTLAEYDRLLFIQMKHCAICDKPERQTRNGVLLRLAIDHNHTTNKVRGLLCSSCNRLIGHLENAEWLQKAQSYLKSGGILCYKI